MPKHLVISTFLVIVLYGHKTATVYQTGAVIFFSVTYKGRERPLCGKNSPVDCFQRVSEQLCCEGGQNCNNSADNCCCTCNNSNKPVNIHCKASSYSNSGNPVECGRHLALIKEPLKKNSPSGLFFRFIYHECSLDLSSACSGISNNCILSLNILFVQ